MFSLTEGCGCVSFRGGRRTRSLGDDSSSCRSSEIEQEVPKKIGRRMLNGECTMKALAPFLKFWKKDDVSMTKAERTMKAAILIQQWYRRYLARMEVRRRYTWTIFQSIEYAGEQDQVKLYNFFNALLSHMRETSGRPSSERTSRTASVLEQVFSDESDEGGGVDETAPPKNCREPDIEFPLQRKDIDLLIEAFRKKKHRLHPKLVAQILKEASQMLRRLPNINVATTSISSQITICGDLHGKLDDLLVIFHKNGLPSPENPYIFNGDFVDRGKKGLEVLLLLLACMLSFPGGVYLNRGNHEDLVMNTRYGFIREVHQKYRHNAERLLKLIENVYRWLPLGTIINNRVFVVHGGISDTTDLDMVRGMDRDKYASLLRPPLNEGTAPGAEGIDKVEWKQVFDILWSDPQSTSGCVANALRGAGTYFGPDVTTSFLNKNKLSFIIRSHECKPGGYEILHNGNVITIFSASNYYELGSNKGAYLKLCGNSLDRQFVQYTAAVSRTRRLTFRQRVGLVESSAMRELHSHIMTARRTLEATFRSMDLDQSGFISISDWCYAMEETTHLGLPWRMLKDKLVRTDLETRSVRYMDTFDLLANKIGRKSDAQTVVETLYKNKRSLEAIFKILDKDNSAMKAAILIQQWYRRYLARMEVRRRYTWTIFQSIEYAGEQDQVKLYNFFNALLSHMRETSGRPSSERTSRTASVLEQVFSDESDEGGGVDETAPPKNCREPDIEFPLQRKDIDLLIEAFRKKKHRLHPKLVAQILKEASQMLRRLPNINVATTSISSQITICGDLHGKLDDLLVIFHKNGLPSPENPYIFNGDFVDRGKKGLEVLLLLLACMLSFPGGVYLNRGNHEDLVMNTRYGFIREVHQKYRHNAERLLKLIENVYRWLPLGTIINNRVFVVHGGISDTTDLDMVRGMDRDKYASLLRPPLNEGAAPGAEGIDKVEWKQVFDILWSDPQSTSGCVANALRGAGTYFGPDVTTSFLNKNKLSFIIRSHECKPGGYEILHNGNVITIFSASNYYELGSNKGAYLKLCGNSLDRQFVQYTAAVSRTRRLTFRQRVGLVESSAMRELHSHIMTARRTLEATFRSMDLDQSGFISISDWCYAMEETTHLGLPWRMLKDKLVRTDLETRSVRYMDTFDLLANKIGRKSDAQTVVETLYKNKRSLEAIFKILDKDNSGYITLEEFSEACQLLGKYMPNPLTQEQLVDICRLMDINKDGLVDLNEFLESFRLAEKSLHEDEHTLAEMKAS